MSNRALPAALAGLMSLACVGGPAPLELYRLAPVAAPAPVARSVSASDTMLPTISVEPYSTTGIYADPGIVYRIGETTYGAYPHREWALPLGTMLADATVETLRGTPSLGAKVTDERASASHQLVWRGVVQQFEEVNRGDRVSAAVRLEATLVQATGDSLVWQGYAALERPVAEPTMPAVVEALSALTGDAVRQLVASAESALSPGRLTPAGGHP